ncbi:Signal transduction histidine kinase [Microbacterium hydrothermale]|uniref:sensor histidine kinase n=1 Tax=Microbacterium hydrothermale TaxID=857427 RepID=UPI0022266D0F|nr:histidine kinase [Microbacterium hydrothermale]MCW2163019.1 Signal transduction histidine kinase [Microbacterium hydrothermale]
MPTKEDPPAPTLTDADGFTRVLGRPRSMAVFAAIVFVVTVVQALINPLTGLLEGEFPWEGPPPLSVVIALVVVGCAAQSAFLFLCARAPLIALAGTAGCYVALVAGLSIPRWLTALPLVVAVAVFFVALSRRAVVAVGAAIAVVAVVSLSLLAWAVSTGVPAGVVGGFTLETVLSVGAPIAGATALGIWSSRRLRAFRRTRAELAEAAAVHAAEMERVTTLERARIAQELHDVAGQHLAGLLSLADAAVDIEVLDTAQASALISEMRAEGRFASASLYAALRDLRIQNGSRVEPTLDLRSLDDLRDFWSARGMRVAVDVRGEIADLPAMVSTTAYRVVQEALTNAGKHAPGAPTTVEVDASSTTLLLSVQNDPAVAPRTDRDAEGLGWGLTGMAERVDLIHGSLSAGPRDDGGWSVILRAPIGALDPVSR